MNKKPNEEWLRNEVSKIISKYHLNISEKEIEKIIKALKECDWTDFKPAIWNLIVSDVVEAMNPEFAEYMRQ